MKPSASLVSSVRNLANRLENATAVERIDALTELQSLARTESSLVGVHALQKVLYMLREQGSTEEYQEALDLINRLVTTRDHTASMENIAIIMHDTSNIELFIDLLEHEDITVGLFTSQILSEIHARDGLALEKCIHDCKAGMHKLLQRLPDTNREEVRNQAIILVQQLTANNDEMKKVVVFDEGFEKIFGIIANEGGCYDAGLVIQDCLRILNNVLTDSEVVQRYFYNTNSEWIIHLSEFFSPETLESFSNTINNDDDSDETMNSWFHQQGRIECGKLALHTIAKSLIPVNKKHQNIIGITISEIVPSTFFWIGRKGPSEFIDSALLLLDNIISNNRDVANHVANLLIKSNPAIQGVNIPIDVKEIAFHFGFKPLPNDDRQLITVPALLAERYIYSSTAWEGVKEGTKLVIDGYNTAEIDGLSQGCLNVLETLLLSDKSINDMIIQHIIAPPPPSYDLLDSTITEFGPLENNKPLGQVILSGIVDGCNKLIASNSSGHNHLRTEVEVIERSCNVMTLLLSNGSNVARELFATINSSHISTGDVSHAFVLGNLSLLAGQIAKSQITGAYTVVTALLRLLASSCQDNERAVRHLFEDPLLFFVLDLTTSGSESAGVPLGVQVMACFFLGISFLALPTGAESNSSDNSSFTHSRASFLSMIDNRVGLNRFIDILRRPLQGNSHAVSNILFITKGFKGYFEQQVETIRVSMYEIFADSTAVSSGSHPGDNSDSLLQIIELQKVRISELEEIMRNSASSSSSTIPATDAIVSDQVERSNHNKVTMLEAEVKQLKEKIDMLNSMISNREVDMNKVVQAHECLQEESSKLNDEIVYLKSSINELSKTNEELQSSNEAINRKYKLLESELTEDKGNTQQSILQLTTKINELESRNSELKQELWNAQDKNKNNELPVKQAGGNSITDSKLLESLRCLCLTIGVTETNGTEVKDVIHSINDCIDKIYDSAGQCSDMANWAGFTRFTTTEGSLDRMSECCGEITKLLQGNSGAYEELELMKANYSNLTVDYNGCRAENDDLLVTNADLQANFTSISTQATELTSRCRDLESQVEQSQHMVESLRAHIALLESQKASEQSNADTSLLQSELYQAQLTIQQLQTQLTNQNDEWASILDTQITEQLVARDSQWQTVVDSLNAQLQANTTMMQQRIDELEAVPVSSDESQSLRDNIASLEEQLRSKSSENTELTSNIREVGQKLEQETDKVKELNETVSSLQQQLQSHSMHLSELSAACDQNASTLHNKDIELKKCNDIIASLRDEYDNAIRANDVIHNENNTLQTSCTQLNQAINEMQQEKSSLQQELQKLQIELNNHQNASMTTPVKQQPNGSRYDSFTPTTPFLLPKDEQMTDLLSLLAQQEVEISVFRHFIATLGGPQQVDQAAFEAQKQATERYGSYTDFRNESIEAIF